MFRSVIVAALMVSGAATASAGESLSPIDLAQHIFRHADADKDGVLTAKEHEAAGLGRYGVSFVDFDLDDDNRVSWEEYRALFERHHKAMGEQPV